MIEFEKIDAEWSGSRRPIGGAFLLSSTSSSGREITTCSVNRLVIATGAGWEMRRSLGTAVFSVVVGVTLFGVLLTPVFYYVITWFGDRKKPSAGSPVGTSADGVHKGDTVSSQLARK